MTDAAKKTLKREFWGAGAALNWAVFGLAAWCIMQGRPEAAERLQALAEGMAWATHPGAVLAFGADWWAKQGPGAK